MILDFFKKKKTKEFSPQNISSFIENSSEEKLNEFISYIPVGQEFDYTFQCWGHAFSISKTYRSGLHYGHGFHTAIFGSEIKKGDILLLKNTGAKIGRYMVLDIQFEHDPPDMFWAYIACIGFKE